ncbi:hypothetical protein C161_03694 [Paenibacillus sp. FSL R5-192]|nr:hypothetical protein C161_03694 [Paenibacillus sp. FSL R5-192]
MLKYKSYYIFIYNRRIIEIASAVYRVENEQIAEYWIQIDRMGIEKQLERNRS